MKYHANFETALQHQRMDFLVQLTSVMFWVKLFVAAYTVAYLARLAVTTGTIVKLLF